jgi:hypothetical protein
MTKVKRLSGAVAGTNTQTGSSPTHRSCIFITKDEELGQIYMPLFELSVQISPAPLKSSFLEISNFTWLSGKILSKRLENSRLMMFEARVLRLRKLFELTFLNNYNARKKIERRCSAR